MSMNASSGGRRRMSDINVTPMVDVMLVLLVIFMITAPTMKEGFSVEIPQADATQSVEIQNARIITVTADGDVLRDRAVVKDDRYDSLSVLSEDLRAYKTECAEDKRDPVVVIVGDRNARYERIIQVWNAVRNAGIPSVSFQVEPGAPGEVAGK